MVEQYVYGKVAVFIDAANIERSAQHKKWRIDYKKLYEYLRKEYAIVQVSFYTARFNNAGHDRFLTVLKKIGYTLITKPLKLIGDKNNPIRKANFDVEIAVDAVHYKDTYDTIMLFSGDSDFAYLLQYLSHNGKKTIVISTKYHIAKELIQSADRYIDMKKIARLLQRAVDDSFATAK